MIKWLLFESRDHEVTLKLGQSMHAFAPQAFVCVKSSRLFFDKLDTPWRTNYFHIAEQCRNDAHRLD